MVPTHPTDRLRPLEGSTGLRSTDNAALPHARLGLRAAGFFIRTTLVAILAHQVKEMEGFMVWLCLPVC